MRSPRWPLLALLALTGCRASGPPGWRDEAGYHVRGGEVFYLPNWTSPAFAVEGADAATFECPLPGGERTVYARDRSRVYHRGRHLPGADAASFSVIDARYARDASQVYLGDAVVCDDPAHFEVVGAGFVKNSRAVYRLEPLRRPPEERVVSRDPAHFRRLAPQSPGQFHADSSQLFVGNEVVPGIDPARFRWLGGSYWADGRRVFHWQAPVDGAGLAAFEVLEGGAYARDRSRVYYLGNPLSGADPGSFEVTDPRWPRARDARQGYDQGRIVARPPQ